MKRQVGVAGVERSGEQRLQLQTPKGLLGLDDHAFELLGGRVPVGPGRLRLGELQHDLGVRDQGLERVEGLENHLLRVRLFDVVARRGLVAPEIWSGGDAFQLG